MSGSNRHGLNWSCMVRIRPEDGRRKLMGTVKYPAQATPRRSSLSRVPENGMHGWKGETRNGLV
jgi:hypothetical protein